MEELQLTPTTRDRGANIQTYSGRPFYVLDPRVEEIEIVDVAHALSNLCRFTGHSLRFLSVAEHSIIVSEILRHDGCSIEVQMQGLLHDAVEAYVGDFSSPLKQNYPILREIQHNVSKTVHAAFGLPEHLDPAVREADLLCLDIERRHNMAKSATVKWGNLPDSSRFDSEIDLLCMQPGRAETAFLDLFKVLSS